MPVELPSSQTELRALLSSAVSSRAAHIRKNKETITMANVRRLLEEDLGLDKCHLDPHKSIINPLVDEVLLGTENVEELEEEKVADENASAVDEIVEGKSPEKASEKVSQKKPREEESSDDVNSKDSQEDLSVEVPKKKKQKTSKKEKAPSKEKSEQDSDEHREVSESSDISEVKKPKKLVKTSNAKVAVDKTIDHLRKTIKACGLGIPPAIYKKAKQLDGEKQNNFIIKELEGILNRQGLSSNPTEKEMKAVKKRIAREKDLEGIDMTNIITEPRSRRTASQMFSPVYKPPKLPAIQSDSEEDEKITNGGESSEDDVKKPENEDSSAPGSAGNDHIECAEPAEKD